MLLLINFGYSQMISLGPFTLLESMESVRAKCISLKHLESFGSLEQYVVDDGGKFPFQLMFSGNQVYSISMIADNSSDADYERAVNDFTKSLGRYPDNKYGPSDLLPIHGAVHVVTSRLKSLRSAEGKAGRKNLPTSIIKKAHFGLFRLFNF